MSSRNRLPRQSDNHRGYRDGPPARPVMQRGPGPLPPHPAALEEELEIQHRDMQRILADNRHVLDENVMLERELTAVKDEILRLGQFIPKLHGDNEVQAREYIERGLKLEAELHSAEPLRAELGGLRADAQKLNGFRQELSTQVQSLTKDLNQLQTENKQVAAMKADIDGMRKELVEARRVYELEKKENTELVEQNQAMEKDLVSMAREMERLRAEQMAAERRARGLGVGPYGMLNESPEMGYPSGLYGDPYSAGAWGGPYDRRGPPRR
ncbi:PREDICTED: protein FLX-like 3 [Ipomoea nil]|uniref:protein FLX-like 3 n=1 Tax=Ipomoea nil TaxID=35883 RepID=UPI0009019EA2|nr:PREDICTED: protein FLX-like 3 [Ipomoea nil]